MKLILLRHAKSGWDDPLLDDHDRPLNARGRASAPLIGEWLRKQGHVPDVALCSSAVRTQETLNLLGFPKLETEIEERLYLASEDVMQRAVNEQDVDQCVLLLAHNPGLGGLALDLSQPQDLDPDVGRFPTCACLVLEFEDRAKRGQGRVLDFTIPRRLEPLS